MKCWELDWSVRLHDDGVELFELLMSVFSLTLQLMS